MIRRLLLWVVFLASAAPVAAIAQQRAPDAAENRIALVIGNANYSGVPLANPVNDARAVATALGEAGFQVKLRTDLTQSQMRQTIREFGDELHEKRGVGLFFFAGHGVQLSNRNFLIPVGADIQREYEVEDRAVDAGSVLAMMESAKARVNIVILDACRNNPFMRNFRSAINGLAPMQAPAGTLVAFSTAPGQTASDGAGEYGLYTEHLVQNLAVPGLKIEDVFKNVRVGVQRISGGKQVPWENTSLTGDFYFRVNVKVEIDDSARIGARQEDIDRAVKQALMQREEKEAARYAAKQSDIERAVLAVLKMRETKQAEAQKANAVKEIAQAKAAIEQLNQELAELKAARESESQPPAAAAPTITPPAAIAAEPSTAQAVQVTAADQPPAKPPVQVALAAPGSARQKPVVTVGGRVERPDVRSGDQWKYQVTDLLTELKETVVIEVATVTANRVYTRSGQFKQAALGEAAMGHIYDAWDRDWNQLREGDNEFTPYYPNFQFPLEVGKTWSGQVMFTNSRGNSVTDEISSQVVGWERITVPAGTYDAVRINQQGYFNGRSFSGRIDNVHWYSPALRQAIKKEISRIGSNTPIWQRWELVEYKSP